MSHQRLILSILAAGLCALAVPVILRAAALPDEPASVSGFQLAGGFGADGYKTWDIKGKQAQAASADAAQIDITDMKLRLYSGGPSLSLETTIASPQATVLSHANQVSGPGFLYIS